MVRERQSSPFGSGGFPKRSCAVRTARERAEEQRQLKLELIRDQVQSGLLVIRQITDEERSRYPPRSTPVKRAGRRYG
jgi:hypothetical protein